MHEREIIYQRGAYWIRRAAKGFEVYRISDSGTHSMRCATIGFEGAKGIEQAKAEIERRLLPVNHRSKSL